MEVFSVIRNCSNFCLQMFWSLEKWWVYFVCMINKGLSRSFVPTIDKIQLWQYSSTAILIDAFLRLRLRSDLEQSRRIGGAVLPIDAFYHRHMWIAPFVDNSVDYRFTSKKRHVTNVYLNFSKGVKKLGNEKVTKSLTVQQVTSFFLLFPLSLGCEV